MLNVSKNSISNYPRNPEHHGTKKHLKSKALMPSDERNIIQQLKKKDSTVSKFGLQARLTHALHQIVYNYIEKSKVFILIRKHCHPKCTKMHVAYYLSVHSH